MGVNGAKPLAWLDIEDRDGRRMSMPGTIVMGVFGKRQRKRNNGLKSHVYHGREGICMHFAIRSGAAMWGND